MATLYEFTDLKKKYEAFADPISYVEINGKEVGKGAEGPATVSLEVTISSGFEAGVAVIKFAKLFDVATSRFDTNKIKSNMPLGSTVRISLGYGNTLRDVFHGFISQVGFEYREKGMPLVRITCMDIKGIMMNGNYNKQLKAKDYSGAVREIFEKTSLKALTENSIYDLAITDTPDHKEAAPGLGVGGDSQGASGGGEEVTAFSAEMVNETDYEFIVRAAKKFNYEFFCVSTMVYFRKARAVQDILADIGPEWLIRDFNLEYNITGLVKTLEVRGVNPDKGEVLLKNRKLSNKISLGSKANKLIADASFILQDPTIVTVDEADTRLDYLENEIGNRFARLNMEINGIPEIVPGYFMNIKELTDEISKKFYIKAVTHVMRDDVGYFTRIEATAPTLNDWS